jgi:hypothetical protein
MREGPVEGHRGTCLVGKQHQDVQHQQNQVAVDREHVLTYDHEEKH